MSVTQQDIFNMSYIIAKSAFHSGQDYMVKKFSQDAISKSMGNNPIEMAIARILDGLSCLSSKTNQAEVAVLKLIEVVMPNDSEDFENKFIP